MEAFKKSLYNRKRIRQVGKKMKGAKGLSKYAALRLKRSHAQPSASRSPDISGWLSFKSPQSILSALSHSSLLSFASIASIGSAGSILSIGSVGSILSIGKAGAAPGGGSVEPEAEILLEEEVTPEEEDLLEEEILPEEGPAPGEARPMPPPGEPSPERLPPDPMP